MRKKLVKILLILVIAIFAMQLNVHAAVISSTDKEVKSNSGSVTISVTSKQALGAFQLKLIDTAGLTLENATKGASTFELSGDKKTISGSSSDGITNLGSFTFKVPTVTSETTYKIKFSITGMETTNLDIIEDETNTAVLKVIPVVEKPKEEEPETNNQQPVTPPAPVEKSSEARLSNFGIKPNDFSGFKRDKYEYSTTVPNSIEKVTIYAEKVDSKATVEGIGEVTLKEGSNPFEIKVTAEDGKTTKIYKLTINRKTAAEEAVENGEARLKSLGIKPEKYDFKGFDSAKTEYSAEVPHDVEEIEVYATAMNSSAQITGTGMIELEEGLNKLEIGVIAADGTKKTYILEVTRKEADEVKETTENKFGLSTLSIAGLTLDPSFKVGIYEYNVELKEDITSLEIEAKANNKDATVEIIGNESLKEGENTITILVNNEKTEDVVTYQIIVNKNISQEVIGTSWMNPSTWGKEEIIKLIIIIVLLILIVSAIALKIKIAEENDKANTVDFPGAEELDKAIAEHQELAEEEMNNEEELIKANEVKEDVVSSNYIEEIAKNKDMFQDEEFAPKPKRKGKHF